MVHRKRDWEVPGWTLEPALVLSSPHTHVWASALIQEVGLPQARPCGHESASLRAL